VIVPVPDPDFRYQLRRFLRFSEEAVREEGITPLQYLLLLHVKGSRAGNGPPWASSLKNFNPITTALCPSCRAAKSSVWSGVRPMTTTEGGSSSTRQRKASAVWTGWRAYTGPNFWLGRRL